MQTVLYVPKSLHIPAETLVSPYLMKVQPFSEDGIIPSGASTLYILASGAVLKRNRAGAAGRIKAGCEKKVCVKKVKHVLIVHSFVK